MPTICKPRRVPGLAREHEEHATNAVVSGFGVMAMPHGKRIIQNRGFELMVGCQAGVVEVSLSSQGDILPERGSILTSGLKNMIMNATTPEIYESEGANPA